MKKLLLAVAALSIASGCVASGGLTPSGAIAASAPCAIPASPTRPELKPTTIDTLKQAYDCVLTHYYGGPVLDDRTLLAAAFAGFVQELQRRGQDQPTATMPELSGDRNGDWAAFSAVYQRVSDKLPADPTLRQALATSTMKAMVAALNDNHASWDRPLTSAKPKPEPESKPESEPKKKGGKRRGAYGIGVAGVSSRPGDPVAKPPLFVTSVMAGSPAARQGVRPGDVIVSVNGVTPFINGVLSAPVLEQVFHEFPQSHAVRLELRNPSTGRTRTTTLRPTLVEVHDPVLSAKRLSGGIAYVKVPEFFPGVADQALGSVTRLREDGKLGGVILDLRGNGGGSPEEVPRLLGAFAHGKTSSYFCDVRGACAANRTDDTVPLLNLPLVALTDRDCASACDDFSAAVKGLGLGALVGTRTAGVVSGPNEGYVLDDGSVLLLPKKHHRGPDKELVDTIGVAVDHHVPMTALDLSTGRDPGVAKALQLLT